MSIIAHYTKLTHVSQEFIEIFKDNINGADYGFNCSKAFLYK
jgi:hypothetical protein